MQNIFNKIYRKMKIILNKSMTKWFIGWLFIKEAFNMNATMWKNSYHQVGLWSINLLSNTDRCFLKLYSIDQKRATNNIRPRLKYDLNPENSNPRGIDFYSCKTILSIRWPPFYVGSFLSIRFTITRSPSAIK